jgi:hypothetical protein
MCCQPTQLIGWLPLVKLSGANEKNHQDALNVTPTWWEISPSSQWIFETTQFLHNILNLWYSWRCIARLILKNDGRIMPNNSTEIIARNEGSDAGKNVRFRLWKTFSSWFYAIPFYDSCSEHNSEIIWNPTIGFWIFIKSKLINWRCVNGCVYQMWLKYILHIYVAMFDGLILIFTGQIQFLTINTFFADWSSMFVGSILCLTVKIWFWCLNGLVQELYPRMGWSIIFLIQISGINTPFSNTPTDHVKLLTSSDIVP